LAGGLSVEGTRLESRSAGLLFAAADADFTLVDVGCSGGIDPAWRLFDKRLTAYAFDPSRYEIERLAAAETNPNVHYINGFVGLPAGHPARAAAAESWRVDPWARLSAYRTQSLQRDREKADLATQPPAAAQPEPVRSEPARAASQTTAAPAPDPAPSPFQADEQQDLMRRNLWAQAALSNPDQPIVLEEFLSAVGVRDMDFIKIDVDGADFEILQSLEARLAQPGVLGALLEVSFHGTDDPAFNTFHNVDRFMRARGFDLFDLTVRKYSLAVLPRPYLFPHPLAAQTTEGRPLQGDALYLRDFGHIHADRDLSGWTDQKLLKLGALYALFGLFDHTAELLQLFRERLAGWIGIDQALDVLVQEIQDSEPELWSTGRFFSYGDYIAAYEADDPAFYGANERRYRLSVLPIVERDEARCALMVAERDLAQARHELVQALHDAKEIEATLAAMRRSLSWRLTAGLRALRALLRR
jgi:hypothetical protein